jgi:predicted lipid-binding transport protein (Tim44 family)
MIRNYAIRPLLVLATLAVALLTWSGDADARAGRGFSFGSRGARTFTAPPVTRTTPNAASPIQRSVTPQYGQPSGIGRSAGTGGFLNRPGLLGGLAAGFLGAGLFGLLFGHGLFGGLGGMASFLGLLLQVGLVVILGRLVWAWWQGRHAPAFAGLSPRQLADAYGSSRSEFSTGMHPSGSADLTIGKNDYDAFERLLGDIQTAYGREDLNALRTRVTPEMLSYFSEDLARNASRGVVNVVSDVKLRQGDLAEAWSERDFDYASVAMRFSLLDRMVDRASGRVVEGDAEHPTEATEVWTFMRSRGGSWLLSSIQQA